MRPAHALIKPSKCLISAIDVHNGIWGFKPSWGNCNSLCGLPLPYGGGRKVLCKRLRHSFCNHFNGQMPPGQEVVAECTNSAGLVSRPAKQMWPYGGEPVHTQVYVDSVGGFWGGGGRGTSVRGISENQAFRHTLPFLDSLLFFSRLQTTRLTKITSQKGGTSGTTRPSTRQEVEGRVSI